MYFKKCNCCGVVHGEIPRGKLVMNGKSAGLYFNCFCGSTLLYPKHKLMEEHVWLVAIANAKTLMRQEGSKFVVIKEVA